MQTACGGFSYHKVAMFAMVPLTRNQANKQTRQEKQNKKRTSIKLGRKYCSEGMKIKLVKTR